MALKTSLVIAGDATSAVAALDATEQGAASLAAAMAKADQEINRLARAQATANQEMANAKAAFAAGELSLEAYNARVLETRTALSLFEGGHRNAVTALKQAQTALQGASVSAGQAQAGYVNLGRQMQDIAVELQGGINIGTIVAQQGGQVADAMAQMGGKFSGLASFLAGPWGAAIIVGTGVLINFAEAILKSGNAAQDEMAELKQNAIQTELTRQAKKLFEQSEIGVRQAILDQKEALDKQETSLKSVAQQAREHAAVEWNRAKNIRNATAAMLEQALAQEKLDLIRTNQVGPRGDLADLAVGVDASKAQALQNLLAQQQSLALTAAQNMVRAQSHYDVELGKRAADPAEAIKKKYEGAGGLIDLARQRAVAEGKTGQALQDQVAKYARLERAELDATKKHRKESQKADPSIAADKFQDDTESRIDKLVNQYSELPSAIQKARGALLDLDTIEASIDARAKGKGADLIDVARLKSQVADARDVIEASIAKPFNDYLKTQRESVEVDNLMIAGREDEANALKVVLGLQKQMGPLTADQADQVLATVTAERQRALVLRDQKALIQANVAQVTAMRSALQQTVADALKGKFSLSTVVSSAANAYINSLSQQVVEQLVGKSLRSLEDEASQPFAKAMKTGETSVTSFADAVAAATQRVNGSAAANRTNSGAASGLTGDDWETLVAAQKASSASGPTGDDIASYVAALSGIEVVAKKSPTASSETSSTFLNAMKVGLSGLLGIDLPNSIIKGMEPLFRGLEKALPDAFHGAMTGTAVSSLLLGSGSNSLGAGIGGAIGEVAGKKFLAKGLEGISSGLGGIAGPLGGAIGGVLGGLLGGLFTPTKAGTVVINSGKSTQTASTAEVAQGLTTISTSIQSTLEQIANQFSTSVGSYAVSIGQYKDYYRVSASGSDHVGDKYYPNTANGDNLYDGTSQSQAILIAIQNAIQDGAIKGLSAAVKKALGSSSDVEKAMAEALKVQDLELALGGVQASLEKEFRTFENTAEDRVALAKKYGFDLVKVEELNNKERLDLSKKLLKDQVGSLQDLIDQMTSGSLFEGTLVDKRAAILTKIDAAKAAVAAGESGAADTLAQLLSDLASASKDAYGTTGAYASDRTLITDTAQQTIAAANAAITAAEAATTSSTASSDTSDQLNEANDLLAKMAARLEVSVDYLKLIASSSDSGTLANLKQQAGY